MNNGIERTTRISDILTAVKEIIKIQRFSLFIHHESTHDDIVVSTETIYEGPNDSIINFNINNLVFLSFKKDASQSVLFKIHFAINDSTYLTVESVTTEDIQTSDVLIGNILRTIYNIINVPVIEDLPFAYNVSMWEYYIGCELKFYNFKDYDRAMLDSMYDEFITDPEEVGIEDYYENE